MNGCTTVRTRGKSRCFRKSLAVGVHDAANDRGVKPNLPSRTGALMSATSWERAGNQRWSRATRRESRKSTQLKGKKSLQSGSKTRKGQQKSARAAFENGDEGTSADPAKKESHARSTTTEGKKKPRKGGGNGGSELLAYYITGKKELGGRLSPCEPPLKRGAEGKKEKRICE